MKRILPVFLSVILLITFVGCSSDKEADNTTKNILETFAEITKIPRPSHQEQQISCWLKDWASERGFPVLQDMTYNIIIDVPATKGMEDKPLVALQGHMDMVFATANGSDPMSTEIKVENDGVYLTSDGTTSLGADDGIGLAIMLNIASGEMDHGPLRLIITTSEEDGMVGAHALNPEIFSDVKYLINMDAESEGSICLSTAASVVESFSKTVSCRTAFLPCALKIKLEGFRGGHSGLDIGLGRLSAIRALTEMLGTLDETGVEYEVVSLSGGSVPNAIPIMAEAEICIPDENTEDVRALLLNRFKELSEQYKDTDPDMHISIETGEKPNRVLDDNSKAFVLEFLKNITDGVVTTSADVIDLVESSSNFGLLLVNESGFNAKTHARSSSSERLSEILYHDESLGAELGMEYAAQMNSGPWPYNPDSRLAAVADEVYFERFGEELGHLTVHAGLECGTFAVYNPDIDMIAVGPTLKDVHTVKETLEIASIIKVWSLLEGILEKI